MSARTVLSRVLRAIVEALAPSACAACGGELDGALGPACRACRARLDRELIAERCLSCSAALATAPRADQPADAAEGGPAPCCAACRRGRRLTVHAPRAHAGVARRLIHAFKYRKRRDVAVILARSMAQAEDVRRVLATVDLIVPVPGDPVRRHARGFDASLLLAEELAHAASGFARGRRPRAWRALRARRLPPQASRRAVARRAAPAGSMSARWPVALLVRGQRVALVDDVVTTGATLREAERVLRRLGARSVIAIACTRAPGELVGGRRKDAP